MFGFFHEVIREMIQRKYGVNKWDEILKGAGIKAGTEAQHVNYPDSETFKIATVISMNLGCTEVQFWEEYGSFLVEFLMENGWEELLRAMAPDLQGFLDNLDSLHYFVDHVIYPNAKLSGPSFRCDVDLETAAIKLHYYSKRTGLYPIVKGVIRKIARDVFGQEVKLKVGSRETTHDEVAGTTEHVILEITMQQEENTQMYNGAESESNQDYESKKSMKSMKSLISRSATSLSSTCFYGQTLLHLDDFAKAFPFHFCFDDKLTIHHYGLMIKNLFPQLRVGANQLSELFSLQHPSVTMSWLSFTTYINGIFVFTVKSVANAFNKQNEEADTRTINLKGQLKPLLSGCIMFIGSPNCTTVGQMLEQQISLCDIPLHDATRDMVLLNQSRLSQKEINKQIEEKSEQIQRMASELDVEKRKTELLLREMLPASVAQSLKQGLVVQAGTYDPVTILFTDVPGFGDVCQACTPYQVVDMLNQLYTKCDQLTTKNRVYKVETISDSYLVAAGVPEKADNHTERILNQAIGMLIVSREVLNPTNQQPLRIRAGVHSGFVVAGVVGQKMPRFCLFGDTVNVSSRMESHGAASRIHLSAVAKQLEQLFSCSKFATEQGDFEFEARGIIDVKGKGPMETYWLVRNNKRTVWDIAGVQKGPDNTIDGYEELHSYYRQASSTKQPSLVGSSIENGHGSCAESKLCHLL